MNNQLPSFPSPNATAHSVITDEQIDEEIFDLLLAIWSSIDADFKMTQMTRIWSMFESNVLLAAKQNNTLRGFYVKLARKMSINASATDEAKVISQIIDAGHDYELLSKLRRDCAYHVMVLRVANAEKRERERLERETT